MTSDSVIDRTVLVTGASRGIGRAIALRLASRGDRIAVNFVRDADGARTTCSLAEDAGGVAMPVQADVSDPRNVDAMFSKIEAEWGPVTILVNNSGLTKVALTPMVSDEDWRAITRTNLDGSFFTIRRAFKGMLRARWGRIVNVSSVGAWAGLPGQPAYSASKSALLGLTRTTARELGGRGITCNVVAPGPIETQMLEEMPEAWREQLKGFSPLGRLGTVDEVAAVVDFVCSPEASYLTGALIPVDGGLSMGM